jgi:hypothetical protein
MARTTVRVIVEDAFGNQLVALAPIVVAAHSGSAVAPARSTAPMQSGRHWYGRPGVWLGVAAGVAAGVGLALGSTVDDRQSKLDAILADSIHHPRSEAETAQRRLEQRALQANIAFAGAGVLAVGAVIAFVVDGRREPGDQRAISVTTRRDHAVVLVTRTF